MEDMYSEVKLRTVQCYQCVHCIGAAGMDRNGFRFQKRKCDLTDRWGRMDKAQYCNFFESKRKISSTDEINGYKVRKDQIEDYRTERQWNDSGYIVKEGEKGKLMYSSRFSAMNRGRVFEYFLPDQVEASADPFYSEENMLRLRKSIAQMETGGCSIQEAGKLTVIEKPD